MSGFQRIKDVLSGVIMILFAAAVFFVPGEGYYIIVLVTGVLIIIYGIRLMWFYFTMARFMVGGKSTLTKSILVLDLGLFTFMIARMNSMVIMLYLLGVYAFSGVIDILRAMEIKKHGASGWRLKLTGGAVVVLLTLLLVVFALTKSQTEYLIYGFCIGLIYSAVIRMIAAFHRTTQVFIQ